MRDTKLHGGPPRVAPEEAVDDVHGELLHRRRRLVCLHVGVADHVRHAGLPLLQQRLHLAAALGGRHVLAAGPRLLEPDPPGDDSRVDLQGRAAARRHRRGVHVDELRLRWQRRGDHRQLPGPGVVVRRRLAGLLPLEELHHRHQQLVLEVEVVPPPFLRTTQRNSRFAGGPTRPTRNRSSGDTLGTVSVWSDTKMSTRWNAGKLVTKCANIGGTPLTALE
ncbi:hypothetical protein U9M48_026627 [Paspalum notatum var. saurae]|uniref:Uncharacterized protein n=1 Tax=Paspalum notatum var. saurae TaxID=547442 RepID=A0AAQ3TT29_PASNO